MEPVYELHAWSAFQFGRFEHRLVGYLATESQSRCVVTEPIVGINPKEGTVNVADGKTYRPTNVMDPTQKMDMMYVLGRWVDLNMKAQPREVTEMIVEELKKNG